MQRFKVILFGFLGVLILGGLAQVSAAQVESNTKMRSVSGEISWIDVKLGKLQLKSAVTGKVHAGEFRPVC